MSGGAHNQSVSTKPYLIRAIYDWCTDQGLTPYLAVKVDAATRVPMAYVKNGEIVLNLGPDAVHNLQLGNEEIRCAARFGGVPHEIIVPVRTVTGIFAKESGQGLGFQEPELPPPEPEGGGEAPKSAKPHLRVVK